MNRTLVAAAGIALFASGVLVGLLVRRDGSESAPPSPIRPDPPKPIPSRPEANTGSEEVLKLQTKVRELEAELKSFRSAAPKAGPDPGPPVSPEAIFKGYLELTRGKNPDPEKARALFARLGQLDEKSAGYFIEQFRKSNGPDAKDEREAALELALASGGPATADFIHVLLNDASLDAELRNTLLQELSGVGGGLFSIHRLPISEALGSTAMTLCRSTKPDDRQGGAGLLGGLKTEASRAELRRLIGEDKDPQVRASATLSLGHVGDAASRTFLERLWVSGTSEFSGQGGARFRTAIESALKELAEEPR
jgi:hypothetical protein